MPSVTKRVSLTANGTVENVLSGSQYEFMSFAAMVEIGLMADATGVLATIFSGTDVLAEEGPVAIGTVNVMPKYPDDFAYSDEVAPGDRLTIKLRDTSGVARTVMVNVKIAPFA